MRTVNCCTEMELCEKQHKLGRYERLPVVWEPPYWHGKKRMTAHILRFQAYPPIFSLVA